MPTAILDTLWAGGEADGTPIDDPGGPSAQITRSVLVRALVVEIADHLGYEHGVRRTLQRGLETRYATDRVLSVFTVNFPGREGR